MEQAFKLLAEGSWSDPALRARLERKAAELDDKYLQLEQADAPEQREDAMRCFSKARAFSALAFALVDDDGALHEAIYESLAAVDEPQTVLRLIDEELL